MKASMASMHSPSESKIAFLSRRLENFEKNPSTAFVQGADVGMMLQPAVHLGRFVGGDVVENDMHPGPGLDPLGHMIEEGEEFLGAV